MQYYVIMYGDGISSQIVPKVGKRSVKPSPQAWLVRFQHLALMACGAMAAQSAVNRWVVGSNPTTPAWIKYLFL